MNERLVFVVVFEFQVLKGCDFFESHIVGGMARGYVEAESREQALDVLKSQLHVERLGLVDLEWCVPIADLGAEFRDTEAIENETVANARSTSKVCWVKFDVWDSSAPEG